MDTEALKSYFIDEIKWGWGYQQQIVFSFLCDAAHEVRGGVVLDAGAGHQRYRPFFSDSLYIAQEHPIAGKKNKRLMEYDILADARRIPLRGNSVDLVLSTSSLEHMEYPERFFAESHRVLKPGGALYVNVPFVYAEHEVPYDFQRPTRYGLRGYYTHAGFSRITVTPTSSSLYAAGHFFLEAIKEERKRLRRSMGTGIIAFAAARMANCACSIASRVFEKGPFEDTTFPIGWVAAGYKNGVRHGGPPYASARDFIIARAECDAHTYVEDGRILSR
jgi:SAM-dependent methyltransferase